MNMEGFKAPQTYVHEHFTNIRSANMTEMRYCCTQTFANICSANMGGANIHEHMFREHMFREHAKSSIFVRDHEPILHQQSKSVRLAQPACEHGTNMARTCREHEMMHEASLRFRLFDSYTI